MWKIKIHIFLCYNLSGEKMKILEELLNNKDEKYREFQVKLTPGIQIENIIGVRVPILRKLAKELIKEEDINIFLNSLPHKYYDENMLHGLIISEIKDYDECLKRINEFLPYIDNWAVCDITSPKVFKKNKDKLLEQIKCWVKKKETYTIRFGIEMLMSHFLDDDYKEEYLNLPSKVSNDDYYVKMMQAWFYATALAKQYKDTIKYLENNQLDVWVHNKTIQKAIESYRISDKQKTYLRSLKRK